MSTLSTLTEKFLPVWPLLDERTRRLMAASEALGLGYGGVSLVRRACGLSRKAILKGIREIQQGSAPAEGRVRRSGGGRKPITYGDPTILEALEKMIDDETRGDPESPLRWICKSTRTIAAQLGKQAHPVSHAKVAQLLHDLNYSLQSNRKTEEGAEHPDRDAQSRYINRTVKRCLGRRAPVNSSETTIMQADSGCPPKSRARFRGMISPRQRFPAPTLTESTMWVATPALSMWAPITTREPSRWPRFVDGGVTREGSCIPGPK
jgi:hypothetical protein